ncbi:4-hydroxythreonine-4-phosphate dehydrogenase [Salipaludibacillus neizhouensis]|uniref:4-hydroxythreonine-4-phosphate dehydrogenase n=1 Tax=Salipaludibacillus neizhouensis TaxID=885475 RepID=A0A3A9K7G8_9BACI|nr:4-hydroxythreonine-4-phosphate dehydrogenase PdxA [Salipaludibacillus neizhouensis]RKL66462.1 4-hydroxythreonine-4-phosphate dehydrogenase [Salipaludibacillus neizhouensis]
MNKPKIGLLYGDAAGVGPELVAKALAKKEILESATWILMGDERVFNKGANIVSKELNYQKVENIDEVNPEVSSLWLIDTKVTDPDEIEMGVLSEKSGKAAGDNLMFALNLAKDNKLDGLSYAPMNKSALYKGGYEFMDDIHLVASVFGLKSGFSEVNVMNDVWFTRVTSHIPLKEIAENITKDNVLESIYFANEIVSKAGITPRLAVAGLNPHAGDDGLLGDEENDIIIPAIEEAKSNGVNAFGPFPADTMFLRLEKEGYNCLLAMYHDQAQIGMKTMGFNKGVTISGGLPIVITTAAHGTAFDIAGKNIADPGAFEEALKMSVKLINNGYK